MPKFDYSAPAELFTGRSMRGSRTMRYQRFDTSAEALRFAIETLPSGFLLAAVLKVDEVRYRHDQMRALYQAPAYPLPRKKAADAPESAPAGKPRDNASAKGKRAASGKSARKTQPLKAKSAA